MSKRATNGINDYDGITKQTRGVEEKEDRAETGLELPRRLHLASGF